MWGSDSEDTTKANVLIGAYRKQNELWDVGYKHEYPFARQWEDEGNQEVEHKKAMFN